MSVADGGATLTYKFTGTTISVYGTEGTGSRSKRANSSYTLDGSAPLFHHESVTPSTPDVLFYSSPTLEDTQHTLLIQNLVSGGELQLDYFEVTGSTIEGIQLTSNPSLSRRAQDSKDESLQPAVIAALAIASVAVLTGFIILFVLWRRQYIRERKERSKVQSQDDAQRVPFLNEQARIEPFTSESTQLPQPSQSSHSSHSSRATAPAVMTVTPLQPRPSREPVVATSSSRRNEKRLLPTGQAYTMESISRLNLGLGVGPKDHSVVGQPSDYESEVNAVPPHHQGRENDGGVSILGSSETINPKALRLPPDYRRFYP